MKRERPVAIGYPGVGGRSRGADEQMDDVCLSVTIYVADHHVRAVDFVAGPQREGGDTKGPVAVREPHAHGVRAIDRIENVGLAVAVEVSGAQARNRDRIARVCDRLREGAVVGRGVAERGRRSRGASVRVAVCRCDDRITTKLLNRRQQRSTGEGVARVAQCVRSKAVAVDRDVNRLQALVACCQAITGGRGERIRPRLGVEFDDCPVVDNRVDVGPRLDRRRACALGKPVVLRPVSVRIGDACQAPA